jgi:DNA-binding XRE family transcriptional regulator
MTVRYQIAYGALIDACRAANLRTITRLAETMHVRRETIHAWNNNGWPEYALLDLAELLDMPFGRLKKTLRATAKMNG